MEWLFQVGNIAQILAHDKRESSPSIGSDRFGPQEVLASFSRTDDVEDIRALEQSIRKAESILFGSGNEVNATGCINPNCTGRSCEDSILCEEFIGDTNFIPTQQMVGNCLDALETVAEAMEPSAQKALTHCSTVLKEFIYLPGDLSSKGSPELWSEKAKSLEKHLASSEADNELWEQRRDDTMEMVNNFQHNLVDMKEQFESNKHGFHELEEDIKELTAQQHNLSIEQQNMRNKTESVEAHIAEVEINISNNILPQLETEKSELVELKEKLAQTCDDLSIFVQNSKYDKIPSRLVPRAELDEVVHEQSELSQAMSTTLKYEQSMVEMLKTNKEKLTKLKVNETELRIRTKTLECELEQKYSQRTPRADWSRILQDDFLSGLRPVLEKHSEFREKCEDSDTGESTEQCNNMASGGTSSFSEFAINELIGILGRLEKDTHHSIGMDQAHTMSNLIDLKIRTLNSDIESLQQRKVLEKLQKGAPNSGANQKNKYSSKALLKRRVSSVLYSNRSRSTLKTIGNAVVETG